MIDGARETLRWVKNRIAHASAAMKIVYVLLLGLLFTLAVIFIPFFGKFSEYFSQAHPFAQSFFLVFLFAGIVASVLYSYERSCRVDQLKEEKDRLRNDLVESGEKLKAAQQATKDSESRWNALVDVESRQDIWKRPWLPTCPATVPMDKRGTKTRFLSMLNLKGGVGKTTLTANLAACLAVAKNPLRVLIVDLDFQGNLSDHTVDPQLVDLLGRQRENTVVRLFRLEHDLASLGQLLTPMFQVPGVKVILATDDLQEEDYRLQAEFFVTPDREVRFFFRKHLQTPTVFHEFDLVIFDCPPRLTTSAVNALVCSDYVLIPTKLDMDSINSVPRTIKWLQALKIVSAQLLGVVANDVTFWGGKLKRDDQNAYNYLCGVVAQECAGNQGFVFQSTIKGDARIPPTKRGVVASVDVSNRDFFAEFVAEFRRRISL